MPISSVTYRSFRDKRRSRTSGIGISALAPVHVTPNRHRVPPPPAVPTLRLFYACRCRRSDRRIPPLAPICVELSRFNTPSALASVADAARQHSPEGVPSFMLGNLVREIVLNCGAGGRPLPTAKVDEFARRIFGAADPGALRRLGDDFSEVVVGRLMADQILMQRNPGSRLDSVDVRT